jgi:CRISPR/Cas system endoribonuclease Cas6 (RAMP superfamily)
MVCELSPIINENAAELLYHRAAAAWGSGETFEVSNGVGEWIDLTKLFEQYRMIQILKGENRGNSKSSK